MDGGEGRWLTDASGSETAPAWSPDGTRIVFEREVGGMTTLDASLHVIDADGTDERLILPASGWGMSPRWSPDATEIAYSEPEGIAVIPAEGGERRWLVRDRGVGAFDWMDDGRLLVSMADLSARKPDVPVSLLFHISRGSSTLVTVDPQTEEREAIAKIRGGASDLEVSPDGRQIAFTSEPQTSELGLLAISLMIYAIAGPAALWLAVKSRREEGPSKAATVGLWTGLAVTVLLVIALVAYPAGVLLMHP
jgi:Tol biopolymer transport system component